VPNDGSVEFKPVSDTQIDVTLNLDFGNSTVEDVRAMVEEWKNSLGCVEEHKQLPWYFSAHGVVYAS
jgi:hypothetical protein